MGSNLAVLNDRLFIGNHSHAVTSNMADVLVDCLDRIDSRYVFGVPGGAVEPIYNALARSELNGGIRSIVARHESGAAFMADGFARETGKIGICIATSGPGATNLITGVACAQQNNIPLLVITGQPMLSAFGRAALQESSCTGINSIEMLRYCTGYSSLISHSSQFKPKLLAALSHATQTPGPAHISFPVDILRSELSCVVSDHELHNAISPCQAIDIKATDTLIDRVLAAKRPVFILGGGCGSASHLIVGVCEKLGAAFVTTPDAKGFVNCTHPQYFGVFGFAGHASAMELLNSRPDCIIAFGVKFNEWCSGAWSELLLNPRLIHVDNNSHHFTLSNAAGLHVRGNLKDVCARLIDAIKSNAVPSRLKIQAGGIILSEPLKAASVAKPIKPQALMRELGLRFPANTRFVADAGNSLVWAIHYLQLRDRRISHLRLLSAANPAPTARKVTAGWLRVTMDFAPMGWAIGAAVGIAQGQPNCPVVCLTGDGSYLMSGQEITVAAEQGLTVIFVILNDAAYGMVKHGQRLAGAESIGWQLPTVDYRKLAEALGVPGYVIESPDDFDKIDFDTMLNRKGPTLLDIRIDGEEVPPMSLRMQTLGSVAEPKEGAA